MSKTVNIKATPAVIAMATKAIQIQDACNPRPVAAFLIEVMDHFRGKFGESNGQEEVGTAMSIQNPISVSLLNKLNDLARLEQSKAECFVCCLDLSEGKDVIWELYD
jgi:hypothetical protein